MRENPVPSTLIILKSIFAIAVGVGEAMVVVGEGVAGLEDGDGDGVGDGVGATLVTGGEGVADNGGEVSTGLVGVAAAGGYEVSKILMIEFIKIKTTTITDTIMNNMMPVIIFEATLINRAGFQIKLNLY